MVFTRTCRETDFLALVLRKLGLGAIPINGQMSQVCLKESKYMHFFSLSIYSLFFSSAHFCYLNVLVIINQPLLC